MLIIVPPILLIALSQNVGYIKFSTNSWCMMESDMMNSILCIICITKDGNKFNFTHFFRVKSSA